MTPSVAVYEQSHSQSSSLLRRCIFPSQNKNLYRLEYHIHTAQHVFAQIRNCEQQSLGQENLAWILRGCVNFSPRTAIFQKKKSKKSTF